MNRQTVFLWNIVQRCRAEWPCVCDLWIAQRFDLETWCREVRRGRGCVFQVCHLTGALGFLLDRQREKNTRSGVDEHQGISCEMKGQVGKKLPSAHKRQPLLSQINLGIIIMHLYVNNSEAWKYFWIKSAQRAAFSHERSGRKKSGRLTSPHWQERLEYMCAFILPPLVSTKLFMASRSVQFQCVSCCRSYI